MTIKLRLIISVIAVLVLLLMGNLFTKYIMNQSVEAVEQIIEVNSVKLSLLNQLKNLSDERAIMQRNMVILLDDEALALESNRLTESSLSIGVLFERLVEMNLDDVETGFLRDLRANAADAFNLFGGFMVALEVGFKEEAAEILLDEFDPKYQEFAQIVQNFLSYQANRNIDAVDSLNVMQAQNQFFLVLGFIVSALILALGGFIVLRSISKPLDRVAETMKSITQSGDLSQRVALNQKGELGQISLAIDNLLEKFEFAVSEVNDVMRSLSSGVFDHRVDYHAQGHLLALKTGVNNSITQVEGVMTMLQTTAHNFKVGRLAVNQNADIQLQGGFKSVMKDLDDSALLINETLNGIDRALESLEQGVFAARVNVDAKGDLLKIKNGINSSMGALETAIKEISEVVVAQSNGDLTQSIDGEYAGDLGVLKNAVNTTASKLTQVVSKATEASSIVSSAASEVSQGSLDLSQRVQEQAAALEQTSSTMENINSIVDQNNQGAHQAVLAVKSVQVQASSGAQVMQKTMDAMDKIQASSHKIADIVSLIDGIAFQTNLLALNAAVEAARAGEHGRGFAVVAGEVRALAQKSAEAAKDIKLLIEESVRSIDQGSELASESSKVLYEINGSIDGVTNMINQIAQASEDQLGSIKQIYNAIAQIDGVTQQNAALVEQTSAASESLSEQASVLQNDMRFFKTTRGLELQLIESMHAQ